MAATWLGAGRNSFELTSKRLTDSQNSKPPPTSEIIVEIDICGETGRFLGAI
jgi:hypothetical protein